MSLGGNLRVCAATLWCYEREASCPAQVARGELTWEPARLCRSVLFASKVRGEYIIPVPDMSNTAAMQATKPGWDVVLRGKRFRAGAGVQDQQLKDFADAVAVPGNRLAYSTSTPFILRYKAFNPGSGERGHPVSELTYVIKEGKNKGKTVSGGYNPSVTHTTLDELCDFVVANRGVRNTNIAYEAIAGEEGVIDLASCVGFDLDVKMSKPTTLYSTVVEKFRLAGWLQPLETLLQKDLYLDYVLPKLITFLSELWALRGTPMETPLTLRDFYVSSACKPYVEEQRETILQKGILSFHVVIPRLMFQNQADRNAFKRACEAMLGELLATVDIGVWTKNHNMRLPAHRKFDGEPLMPYSRGKMYGDDEEFAEPADIPASTLLIHAWSFVPPESERLFTDDTLKRFTNTPSRPKKPRAPRTGAAGGVVNDDDDDALQDPAVLVAEAFFKGANLPFDRSDYKMSMKTESADPDVAYEIYLQQHHGCSRTCPVGGVHTSNHAKLVVRGRGVFYVCFSKPRGGGKVRTVGDDGQPGLQFDVCRNVYNKLCCEIFLGDLPYSPFEVPTDITREARLDLNGILREDVLTEDTFEQVMDAAAKKCPSVSRENLTTCCLILRAAYAAGKTFVMIDLISQTIAKNPYARILYVANSQALVRSMADEINRQVKQPDEAAWDRGSWKGPWRMAHYSDDVDTVLEEAAVAICSQSAPKFVGRYDLVIFDEINAQLTQCVGLTKADVTECDVLSGLLKLARNCDVCIGADANADRMAIKFFETADRIPVMLDTPSCNAFKGRKMEGRALVAGKNGTVNLHATYVDVTETSIRHDGSVSVACSTPATVKALEAMMRGRGISVLAVHGKDSEVHKNHFLDIFSGRRMCDVNHAAGVSGPNFPFYKVFIYSPTVTGGISNHACLLQLAVLSKHGPDMQNMLQQMKRCRIATHTIVWLDDDELLRARVPRLSSLPQEPVVSTSDLKVCSLGKDALTASWNYQAMLRWTGAEARRYDSRLEADEEEDEPEEEDDGPLEALTMDTVYTKPYTVAGKAVTYRMQMAPPPPIPSRVEVEEDECAPDVLAEELRRAKEATSFEHAEVVAEIRAKRFDKHQLLDYLRVEVELERRQRAANLLAWLRADCSRLGIDFTLAVIVVDKATVKRAKAEVRQCFVTYMAEHVMAEIVWYFECMRGRPNLYRDMKLVHAAEAQAAHAVAPGEGDVRAQVRTRCAERMRNVLGEGAACFESVAHPAPDEQDHGLEDGGDTYLAHVIGRYLQAFDEAPEDFDDAPYTNDITVLHCKRFYSVVLTFGEVNLDRDLPRIFHGLKELLHIAVKTRGEEGRGLGLKPAQLTAVERLLRAYNHLFRRDVQAKFRCYLTYNGALAAANGDVVSTHTKYQAAFMRGAEGKRRKLEQPVLISYADDALRKAGVTAGLRAGPGDERRVLLFQNAAKVAARAASRHRIPDWPGEARGERASKIAKASDDIAALCSGPVGARLSLKRSAVHPNERFQELVNACLEPLRMCWENGPKDKDGYKVVKLHDMLREPWVGDHTVDLAEGWQTFWTEVEELKEQSRGVSKEKRRRELEEVLAPMRKPCDDGRRWLFHDALGTAAEEDELESEMTE